MQFLERKNVPTTMVTFCSQIMKYERLAPDQRKEEANLIYSNEKKKER